MTPSTTSSTFPALPAARRASGVLLHPSSLPGPHGIGDFGSQARRFVDWLHEAGQTLWQILPLSPPGPGHSPYMSPSAFAMSPWLIDPEELFARGWLTRDELDDGAHDSRSEAGTSALVDHGRVIARKSRWLRSAAQRFFQQPAPEDLQSYHEFCAAEVHWLEDYALFMALLERHSDQPWQQWPDGLGRRDPGAIAAAVSTLTEPMNHWRFVQWSAHRQWLDLKRHANDQGVRLIGDMPIFVSPGSADVWAHPELFDLDEQLLPRVIAGVPPDYFSATGQRWGNPLYRWAAHEADGFQWWIRRVRHQLRQADLVRIDHFRGFLACWEVPADALDAIGGRWVPSPGAALFDALREALGELPLIAEDLGVITPDVTELREQLGFPGMRVLQFAFGDNSDNPYLPHNFRPDSVVYTGTHDNDTSLGWFRDLGEAERRAVQIYLKTDGRQIGWDLIHAASESVARLAIVPLQDVLELGSEARMNRPGQAEGCWSWRFDWAAFQPWHAERLAQIALAHGRRFVTS